jgi:putative ATPase
MTAFEPLAARMRPATIQEFVGQEDLTGPGKPLREATEHKVLHSMIYGVQQVLENLPW